MTCVTLRVQDVALEGKVFSRAYVVQHKTGSSVKFKLTEQTRNAVEAWVTNNDLIATDFLFPSRLSASPHLSTRQYARIFNAWVASVGLHPRDYGSHTMGRNKATLIYRRTRNLKAVPLLLGQYKLWSTVRYLGNEVDDALEMSEQAEVRSSYGRIAAPTLGRCPAMSGFHVYRRPEWEFENDSRHAPPQTFLR